MVSKTSTFSIKKNRRSSCSQWKGVIIAFGLMMWKFISFMFFIESKTYQTIIYIFFFCMMLWSFYQSIFTFSTLLENKIENKIENGNVQDIINNKLQDLPMYPKYNNTNINLIELELNNNNNKENNTTNKEFSRYCDYCEIYKQKNDHHCSKCKKCIQEMDHHCPWVNNCIGKKNKKYFILFLIYTSLCCLSMSYFTYFRINKYDKLSLFVIIVWFLALTIGSILFGYFCFHLYLLYKGITTLDYLKNGFKYESNNNNFILNFKNIFGTNMYTICIPVIPNFNKN